MKFWSCAFLQCLYTMSFRSTESSRCYGVIMNCFSVQVACKFLLLTKHILLSKLHTANFWFLLLVFVVVITNKFAMRLHGSRNYSLKLDMNLPLRLITSCFAFQLFLIYSSFSIANWPAAWPSPHENVFSQAPGESLRSYKTWKLSWNSVRHTQKSVISPHCCFKCKQYIYIFNLNISSWDN